jgi:predicted dehydrogenase
MASGVPENGDLACEARPRRFHAGNAVSLAVSDTSTIGRRRDQSRSCDVPGRRGQRGDHLSAKLIFGDVPVFIHTTTGGAGPVGTEYTVWGEKRSYRLHSGGRIGMSDGGPWREEFTDIEDFGAADRQRNLDDIARRLNGKTINAPDAADGLAVQELIEALLTCAD